MARKHNQSDVVHAGLVLRWTGWKEAQGNIRLVGQWFTLIGDGWILWAGTNGYSGKASIDGERCRPQLSELPMEGCLTITQFSTTVEKEERKRAALLTLMQLIDGQKNDGSNSE